MVWDPCADPNQPAVAVERNRVALTITTRGYYLPTRRVNSFVMAGLLGPATESLWSDAVVEESMQYFLEQLGPKRHRAR